MSKTIKTEVFEFNELDATAKSRARDWFREGYPFDGWHDVTFDDAVECGAALGITISKSIEKYHVMGRNGEPGRNGQRETTDIFFSGFSSQGDGASFAGTYEPKPDALAAITAHAPKDEKLHAIAVALETALAHGNGQLASITITGGRGHYSHEYEMDYEFHWNDDDTADKADKGMEAEFIEAFRDFARWIYRQLEAEHDYLCSDESVDESITANEYTFTGEGRRFG